MKPRLNYHVSSTQWTSNLNGALCVTAPKQRNCTKINEAAENGFAVHIAGMKFLSQQICDHRKRSYKNGSLSGAAIRIYRAKNRHITYRRSENKDAEKLRADNYKHMEKLAHGLQEISKKQHGIFGNPLHTCNLGEAYVDGKFSERVKVFSGSCSIILYFDHAGRF